MMDCAYYNLGVELKHLRDYEAAKVAFSLSSKGKPVIEEMCCRIDKLNKNNKKYRLRVS